jgi:hypothetical protein
MPNVGDDADFRAAEKKNYPKQEFQKIIKLRAMKITVKNLV